MTIGIDFLTKKETMPDGTQVDVVVYDTAGQERFHNVTDSFYKVADGVLFVFALDDEESLKQVSEWVARYNDAADDSKPRILIGNKSDLPEAARKVKEEDAKKLAVSTGCAYFETSAMTGGGVNKAI